MADPALHQDADPRTRIGDRYVLLGELGRGGMASVHRAHDEVLDREVAVKVLHPHLARDPAFLERFRREARAAAAMSHPNVVGVHDWGESEDGAYLILQLIEGVSLREILRARGQLEPAEALAVLGPAADGLAAAHAAGLVHRDVKPENLLIGRDGTVRVTDFGLARAAASATSTFGADVLVGSPHYLSPEAVDGQQLDARADVYALGIVLFECLVGHPPHEGDTPFVTALRHTTVAVPPPTTRRAGLSEAIDDAVLLATAIDREERIPHAAAFARVLRAAVPEGACALPYPLSDPRDATGTDPAGDGRTPVVDPTASQGHTVMLPGDAGDRDTEVVANTGGHRTGAVTGGHRTGASSSVGSERPRRRRVWLALLAILLLVGGSAAGGYLLWDRVLAPVTSIPGVLGAAEPVAVGQLRDAGFDVAIDGERRHDLVTPEGHVLDQDPADRARLGTTVTLVLSAGPAQVEIAELAGMSVREATDTLEDDGLVASVIEEHDEQVPLGAVISSMPRSGTVVDEGSEVELLVSLGPTPIDVPRIVGESEAAVREALAELGLTLVIEDRRFDPAPAGTILAQDPAPGATLRRGDEVTATVSEGPEQVAVPGIRGQRVGDAVEQLQALGFEVEIERQGGVTAFFRPDRVYDQDPAPETLRDKGSTVVVYAYEP